VKAGTLTGTDDLGVKVNTKSSLIDACGLEVKTKHQCAWQVKVITSLHAMAYRVDVGRHVVVQLEGRANVCKQISKEKET
jgi:hypothetical protein